MEGGAMDDGPTGMVPGDATGEEHGSVPKIMREAATTLIQTVQQTVQQTFEETTRKLVINRQRDMADKEAAMRKAVELKELKEAEFAAFRLGKEDEITDLENDLEQLEKAKRELEEAKREAEREADDANRQRDDAARREALAEQAAYEDGLRDALRACDVCETQGLELGEIGLAGLVIDTSTQTATAVGPSMFADSPTPTASPKASNTLLKTLTLRIKSITDDKDKLQKRLDYLNSQQSIVLTQLEQLRTEIASRQAQHSQDLADLQARLEQSEKALADSQALASAATLLEVEQLKARAAKAEEAKSAAERKAEEAERKAEEAREEAEEAREEAKRAAEAQREAQRESNVVLYQNLKRRRDELDDQLNELEVQLGYRGEDDERDDGPANEEEECKQGDDMSVTVSTTGTQVSEVTVPECKKDMTAFLQTAQKLLNVVFPAVLEKGASVEFAVLEKMLKEHKESVQSELDERGFPKNPTAAGLERFKKNFERNGKMQWTSVSAAVLVRIMNKTFKRLPSANELMSFWKAKPVQMAHNAWKQKYFNLKTAKKPRYE